MNWKAMTLVTAVMLCVLVSNMAFASSHHTSAVSSTPARSSDSYESVNRFAVAEFHRASNPADVNKINSLRAISFNLDSYRTSDKHAANGGLFSDLTPFLEYAYGHNRSRQDNGMITNSHSVTGGLTFTTFADCQAGAIFSVTHTSGDLAGQNGTDFDDDAFTATFFVNKNIEWFYFGTSLTYGYSGGIARTKPFPNARFRTKIDTNTFVVCPYIGAIYVNGPFSASVTPTYMFRHQDIAYRSGVNNSTSEGISDGTFLLANKASYAVTDQIFVDFNFNYNQVVHEDASKYARGSTDNGWITLGPKFTYRFNETMQVYLGYTASVANEDFEDHLIDVGFEMRF